MPPIVALSLAWVGGIMLGAYLPYHPALLIPPLLAAPPLFFLFRRRGRWWLWALCLLAVSLAVWRSGTAFKEAEHLVVPHAPGETVTVRGTVVEEEIWQRGTRLRLSARRTPYAESTEARAVYLYLPLTSRYSYGDYVAASGRLGEYQGRGGEVMFYPRVRLLDSRGGPWGRLQHIRERLSESLARFLPEPQASLSQALLLGMRSSISPQLWQEFTRTGTAHLLAISGVNISIFSGLVLSAGAWALGRRRPYYLYLALALLWLYVLISGPVPSAVRAGIMATLFLWGQAIGRPGAAMVALLFAAAAMTGYEPGLLSSVSFQLSFLAMAGLILIAPPLQSLAAKLRLPRVIGDSLAYSTGAVLATLPLIAYYFGLVSVTTLPATLLAAPALAGAIVTAALVAVMGLVLPLLAYPAAAVGWLFLLYMTGIVGLFANLPWASLSFQPAAHYVWAYYLALAGALLLTRPWFRGQLLRLTTSGAAWLLSRYRRLPPKPVALFLLVVAAVVWAGVFSLPDSSIRVSFLNVGEGDAILIQQGTQQILIDGGPSPSAIATALSRQLPFWDRTIEGVILTHPHADHLTGLAQVLQRYRANWALEPSFSFSSPSPLYHEWQRLLREQGVSRFTARPGTQIKIGAAVVEVLHPPEELLTRTESDIDNNSLVLRLEIGGVSFLFTGDLQWEGEQELLGRGLSLSSSVLKAGHHGSRTSSSEAFLRAVSPQVAVISAGRAEGHPHPEVVARLMQAVGQGIYLTAERGTVTFLTDGQKLRVVTER